MKKISTISLLLVLFSLSSYAQEAVYISSPEDSSQIESSGNKYSKESLAKASAEDLHFYLEKAHKLKRKGGILLIVGPVSSVAGIVLADAAVRGGTEEMFVAGTLLFLGGIGTTLFGFPKLVTGSIRVNKIENALDTHAGVSLNIHPSFFCTGQTHNLYPGVSIRVRF